MYWQISAPDPRSLQIRLCSPRAAAALLEPDAMDALRGRLPRAGHCDPELR